MNNNVAKGIAAVLLGLGTGTVLAAKKNKVPVLQMVNEKLLQKLSTDEEPPATRVTPSKSEFDFACEILGLPKDAPFSKADLKAAAKRFLLEHHPDRFAYLGKSTERLANLICKYASWAEDTITNSAWPAGAKG